MDILEYKVWNISRVSRIDGQSDFQIKNYPCNNSDATITRLPIDSSKFTQEK